MAVEITKQRVFNIGNFINSQVESFSKNRERIRSAQEAEFQRRVLDNGLSNSDQKEYYSNLLKEENKKSVPDRNYISALKDRMSVLDSLIEGENFAKAYRASFERLKTAQGSIDEHIAFLENQADNVKGQELKTKIDDLLSTARQDKYSIQNNVLLNKITFAKNDKRPEILQKTIDNVQQRYNQAIAGGDEETASLWELHLQSLNSQLRMVDIENKVNEFEIKGMNGKFDAVSTLDFFTNMYNNGNGNTPITVNGQTFKSERDFWEGKISNYLNNNFFKILQDEMSNDIDVNAKKLTPVLESKFDNMVTKLEGLRGNQWLRPYLDKLDTVATNISSYGVEKIGEKIVSDYKNGLLGKTSSENITKAIEKLTNLNQWYNVDVKTSLDAIIGDVAGKKSNIANQQIQVYYDKIKEGLSPAEAWKQAESSVASIDIPNTDIVNMQPLDVAKETVSSLDKPSQYDITKSQTNVQQPVVSSPEYKPDSTPQVSTPTIQKGEYIPNPELLSLLKPEQIVTEGNKKYLASGVTAPYRKITDPKELTAYKEEQLIRPKGSNDIYLKL